MVERLALLSKILLDREFLKLRSDLEVYKANDAWHEYSPDAFNRLLASTNSIGLVLVCTCSSCFMAKRFRRLDLHAAARTFTRLPQDCILRACLLHHCERLGLVCAERSEDPDSEEEDHRIYSSTATIPDAHIVFVNRDSGKFWDIEYGTRLCWCWYWHRRSELGPLKKLFELIKYWPEQFFITTPASQSSSPASVSASLHSSLSSGNALSHS